MWVFFTLRLTDALVPEQDLHKIKPVKIFSLNEEGIPKASIFAPTFYIYL